MMFKSLLLGSVIGLAGTSALAGDGDVERHFAALRTVDTDSVDRRAVAGAWRAVIERASLIEILAAMDDAGPVATNWLRAAADSVAEHTLEQRDALPNKELKRFVLDRAHAARARRVAFEWLTRESPDLRLQLLSGMLDDPSLELRYDAVSQLIEQAAQAEGEPRLAAYEQALSSSRNIQQIEACAAELKKLGKTVDLTAHLGFLTTWWVIGPFDNTDKEGFAMVYPPERNVDRNATYQGKQRKVAWQKHETKEKYGFVDLNKAIAKHMGATAYAMTEFYAPASVDAQIRLATFNANMIWLNGQRVDATESYHTGMTLDQYTKDVKLRRGRNVILLKICQNEQSEDWAQSWCFQLRVTTPLGRAIRSAKPGATP